MSEKCFGRMERDKFIWLSANVEGRFVLPLTIQRRMMMDTRVGTWKKACASRFSCMFQLS